MLGRLLNEGGIYRTTAKGEVRFSVRAVIPVPVWEQLLWDVAHGFWISSKHSERPATQGVISEE